jgi:hypothetical protein
LKIAAYIYKPDNKEYDFDEMFSYLSKQLESQVWVGEETIDEIYADGWVEIPNGIDDLTKDTKSYKYVILYSLEGLSIEQLTALVSDSKVFCVMTPWINPTSSKNDVLSKQLYATKKASVYYKSLRSLNIRSGIAASNKRSGTAPFGYKSTLNGIEPDENFQTLQTILELKKKGFSVLELSSKTGLEPTKIYSIIAYWRDKDGTN